MYAVSTTALFRRQIRGQFRWLQENVSTAHAVRWERAADAAMAGLSDMPESFSLTREDDLPRGPYRQRMFGVGRKPPHRLVFRVVLGRVIVEAIRGLSQEDLTAADL